MHFLFEPVVLGEKPLLWGYRSTSSNHFTGFYHWHQCGEILAVHEGSGSIIVDHKTFEIRRGMLFFFQPFQLHKVYASVSPQQPYIRTNIHFDLFAFEEGLRQFPALHACYVRLWQGNQSMPAFDLHDSFNYLEHAFLIHEQNIRANGPNERSVFEHSFLLLLQIMNTLSYKIGIKDAETARHSPRPMGYAEQIMTWIEAHYPEEITLDDIAEAMHLSKFYLSRLFQEETGSSISQYLNARRIKTACRLLQTTQLSIEQVGCEVGIPNPSYFIRLFKSVIGTTPLKYRKDRQA